jgi:glycosyltransferase involved in cell wall biosynthesis
VAVIMPVRNEAPYLVDAVSAVLQQDYPGPLEICLAIAPSTDGTARIAARLAATDPRIRCVENAAGDAASGLNRAIAATTHDIIVRVDGHARLGEGYIARAVETLRRTGAGNVGGRQVPDPRTEFERAVAAATTGWLGTGGARYRVGGGEGAVDTVYLGVFDRSALAQVGGFDEQFLRNQDYEVNVRLRAAGWTVWFDPELAVRYRPRGDLYSLARQYFDYGFWKARVVRRHPRSLRARQLAPALLTAAVGLTTVASLHRRRNLVLPMGYFAALATTARSGQRWMRPAVLATMHISWGTGFWWSVARQLVAAVHRAVRVRRRGGESRHPSAS